MPGPSSSAGRVRAKTTNRSATGALVMNRFSPVITQSSAPSRTALVRRPAGFDPAPGSVSAKEATSPGRHRLQPAGLLLVGAEPDQHLTGDAVVGAEHRPQRQRGVAQLHRQLDVLGEVRARGRPTPAGWRSRTTPSPWPGREDRRAPGRSARISCSRGTTAVRTNWRVWARISLEVVVVDDRVGMNQRSLRAVRSRVARCCGTAPTVCRQRSYMKYDVR